MSGMRVLLEWGTDGLDALGPSADVIVIVDVLSFSTCVDVAVGRGATVHPYRWRDDSAATFAAEHDAHLAKRRGRVLAVAGISPEERIGLVFGQRSKDVALADPRQDDEQIPARADVP